jgi:hypothetical protein
MRLGTALALVALAAGCGRASSNLAVPAQQDVALEAAAEGGPTATLTVVDLGNTLELHLTGSGFATTGAYSVQPLTAYQSATSYRRTNDALPQALPVTADGRVDLLTTFQYQGLARPWVAVGVFQHANGDPTDTASARLVSVAQLPSDLSR